MVTLRYKKMTSQILNLWDHYLWCCKSFISNDITNVNAKMESQWNDDDIDIWYLGVYIKFLCSIVAIRVRTSLDVSKTKPCHFSQNSNISSPTPQTSPQSYGKVLPTCQRTKPKWRNALKCPPTLSLGTLLYMHYSHFWPSKWVQKCVLSCFNACYRSSHRLMEAKKKLHFVHLTKWQCISCCAAYILIQICTYM